MATPPPPPPPNAAALAHHKAEVEELRRRLIATKRKSEEVHHEDDGEGNWLVSYADLMTLLFGFFVILSSMSTPNAEKIEKLKQATSESLGVKYQRPFEDLSQNIRDLLEKLELDKEVTVTETEEGLKINSKGGLFFESGSVDMRPEALSMVEKVSDILTSQAQGFRIVVEGHTDDTPIATKQFPSNWELSSARAGSVVRLLESKGFKRADMRPIGLADTEPLVPNRTEAGEAIPANQGENRRIVIRLQRNPVSSK